MSYKDKEKLVSLKEKRKALDLQIKKAEQRINAKEQAEAEKYFKSLSAEATKAGLDLTTLKPEALIELVKQSSLKAST